MTILDVYKIKNVFTYKKTYHKYFDLDLWQPFFTILCKFDPVYPILFNFRRNRRDKLLITSL